MGSIADVVKRGKSRDTGAKPAVKEPISEAVLDELVHAKTVAKDYAQAFGDAVKAKAEKHGINVGALKKYVSAREADKLQGVGKEAADLLDLIG
jgi:hypothetical protein